MHYSCVYVALYSMCPRTMLICARNKLTAYGVSVKVYFSYFVLQVWLCGGSIEVIPCSKIAHIERAKKPYLPDLSVTMKRNAMRVAEVWLDEFKYNVNIAWNLPLEVKGDT